MKSMAQLKEFNLVIAGIGGQGNLLASEIIASAAVREGHRVRVGETFGAAQRGGPVASYIRIGSEVYSPILDPGRADLIVGLEAVETLRNAFRFLRPGGAVVMNTRPIVPVEVSMGLQKYPSLQEIIEALRRIGAEKIIHFDATSEAERLGMALVMNMIMVGAAAGSGLLPISTEAIRQVITERLAGPLLELNLKAFELGLEKSRSQQ
ncbi:indolepyruvate oxidoreductase subunit beta [Candidatus Bathyarchaeota archaeon]|nr:indolepyruvate oxidoreductase subunit beta [Candidatus Bathyarchaeota archaeon]